MGRAADVQYVGVGLCPNAEFAMILHEARCCRWGIASEPNNFGLKPKPSIPEPEGVRRSRMNAQRNNSKRSTRD